MAVKRALFGAAFAVTACLSLAACKTTLNAVTSADAKVRDKCAYLQSGVAIAQIGVSLLLPEAAPIVANGQALLGAYCNGAPITDVPSALAQMENIIVAVRPIAAKVQ